MKGVIETKGVTEHESPYRNATSVMAGGRRVAYLSLNDALIVGPELDAGASLAARVGSIAVQEGEGRTRLTLTLEERPVK